MAANINTVPFLIAAARDAMETRNLKGQRPAAARAFVFADGEDARADAVADNGGGFTRRGLREQAIFWSKSDAEVANIFWMLRDAIDEVNDTVSEDLLNDDGSDVEIVVADSVDDVMAMLSE